MFDYEQRVTTEEYRENYEVACGGESFRCESCDSFVSSDDTECWVCGEDV
jgi:hypothetical protein